MRPRWLRIPVLGAAVLVLPMLHGLDRQAFPRERDLTVVARACTFTPARLDVNRNDIVGIEFIAADAPYSFVIDEYRIAKRATPGHPVRIEFGAVRVGTFAFYSDLVGCSDMRGTLVVNENIDPGDS